jgi:transposase
VFKAYNPHQEFLLPPSIQDLLPPGDLARIIVEIVDTFDITPFQERYKPLGPHAYNPKMMLGLLFYAYSQGVFSSRKIAERVRYDIRFMFVAGHQQPDFRTISDFRKNHLDLLAGYFKQIVLLCHQLGLIALRTIAIDSTKIKANASTQRVKDRDELAKEIAAIEAEITRRLALAQAADENESELPEAEDDSETRPDLQDLRHLRAKLQAAQAQLEADPRRPTVNLTDPDSRVLKGVGSGYSAQLAVDEKNGLIVACEVVEAANDSHQLIPMIDAVEATTDRRGEAKTILTDAGYASAQAYTELESRPHIQAYVPSREDTHRAGGEAPPFDRSRFSLDPEAGCGFCPLGQPMRVLRRGTNKSGQPYTNFVGTACSDCPRRTECTKAAYRHVALLQAAPAMARMRARMQTPMGQRAMVIRKRTVEPVIGILKEQLGFRRFKLRGLNRVRGEWALLCGAFNLKKISQRWVGISVSLAISALKAEIKAIFHSIFGFFSDFSWFKLQFRLLCSFRC